MLALNFVLVRVAPGDPASIMAGDYATKEQVQLTKERLGLDRPIPEQFGIYLVQLMRMDLGFSYKHGRPVLRVIFERLPATLLLMVTGYLLAAVIGTLLGVVSARYQGAWPDTLFTNFSLSLYAIPAFLSSLLLMLLFSVYLRWLPVSGMISFKVGSGFIERTVDIARHMILPLSAFVLYNLPVYQRITRSSIIEVIHEDFVTTLRGSGINEGRVFYRHALRNGLLPTVSVVGVSLGFVFGGAILTETVFAWPGMGLLMFEAVSSRDYPMLQGIFLFTSFMVALSSLVTDLVYAKLDPRVVYR